MPHEAINFGLFFVHHTPSSFSSLSLQASSDSSSLEDVASALFASAASDVGSLVRDYGTELNLVQSSFDLTSIRSQLD